MAVAAGDGGDPIAALNPGPGLELPVVVLVGASERRPCPSSPTFSMIPKCHLLMTQNPVYRAPPEKEKEERYKSSAAVSAAATAGSMSGGGSLAAALGGIQAGSRMNAADRLGLARRTRLALPALHSLPLPLPSSLS